MEHTFLGVVPKTPITRFVTKGQEQIDAVPNKLGLLEVGVFLVIAAEGDEEASQQGLMAEGGPPARTTMSRESGGGIRVWIRRRARRW